MVKPLKLGCPYCGTTFEPVIVSGSFGTGYAIQKFLCLNSKCEAEWDEYGEPTQAPRQEFETS